MSKEKQMIEELADFLWRNTLIHTEDLCHDVAETIITADYRKQSEGEWVKVMNHKECSKCGYKAPYRKIKAGYHLLDLNRYCPHCGAKMKGV